MKNSVNIPCLIFLLSSLLYAQFWEQTNGPYCGNIYSMAMSSNECVYVGTKYGGIYKTINGGKLWFPINEGLNNIDVHRGYNGVEGRATKNKLE